ncbi:FAD-dependent monooxygenase [Xylophilus sp. GOD-11R]|uniref:FAD-dependent monooxygenase n=1 Tax=Xylophilus sp. GOD-11R TaxID=3089814 RepID=UPI00298BF96F|nr:FAD-dependent monooxygenase [Xylophilus sp. GOD-11R]WPB59492.1 FAD-dependent monooxygenase [Xylophilus sp. GOD-11R]
MLVAGGGIAGLATTLACNRAGWRARVFERAPLFSEVGAGLQLGPNATRILHGWELADALQEVAFYPETLAVRSASDGGVLASMPLGDEVASRYGAPYATLHRADLHRVLAGAVEASGEAVLHLGAEVEWVEQGGDVVRLAWRKTEKSCEVEGDGLVVADGVWSVLRRAVVGTDTAPRPTGHFAWRTLIDRSTLPPGSRAEYAGVTVWLGHRLHVVAYPVRRGELLNLVVLAEGVPGLQVAAPADWNADAGPGEVAQLLHGAHGGLRALVEAAPGWRRWMLHDRDPVAGPPMLAAGRVALAGDAAHPMLPYLAQGAAMSLEDAAELQRVLAMQIDNAGVCLARYALNRWERVGRVQSRARRQATIFHAAGPLRWGRDAALRLAGGRLLDQPWLWGAGR